MVESVTSFGKTLDIKHQVSIIGVRKNVAVAPGFLSGNCG